MHSVTSTDWPQSSFNMPSFRHLKCLKNLSELGDIDDRRAEGESEQRWVTPEVTHNALQSCQSKLSCK